MFPRVCRRHRCSLLKIYCVLVTVLLAWRLFTDIKTRDQIYARGLQSPYKYLTRSGNGNFAPLRSTPINSTLTETPRPLLTRASTADIHIFSVVGVNSTANSSWDILAVSGWLDPVYLDVPIRCCYRYENKTIVLLPALKVHHRRDLFNKTGQVHCLNPDGPVTRHLKGVSLSVKECCSSNEHVYVKPEFPLLPEGRFNFAVCAKIAYGRLDAELALEWMEYHKLLGVTRVLAFQYKLSKAANAVLQYYQENGFLELREFDFPNQDCPHRFVGGVTIDAWNDEQVALFDCQARLHGYQYVAVIDFDEFIVPTSDSNLEDLMHGLISHIPQIGAVEFHVDVFAQNWAPDPKGRLLITRYLNRTATMDSLDIPKVIHIPARTQLGTVYTHQVKVKDAYKIPKDLKKFFAVNHYRACKYEWTDCHTRPRMRDGRILKHALRVTDRVGTVRREIRKMCPTCRIGI